MKNYFKPEITVENGNYYFLLKPFGKDNKAFIEITVYLKDNKENKVIGVIDYESDNIDMVKNDLETTSMENIDKILKDKFGI